MLGINRILVTVGTTNFDKLISTILKDEILSYLTSIGVKHLTLQIGRGKEVEKTFPGLKIEILRFIDDFNGELDQSDLIISHAGAGTCLEVLRKGKKLIVVINEDLMDNHQLELAKKLDEDGFIYYSKCDELEKCIKRDFGGLKKYPKCNGNEFSRYLDRCFGFI